MEDVLETYKPPYDPLRPVVCLDETSRQLIEERHIPVTEPGQIELVDYTVNTVASMCCSKYSSLA